MFPTVELINAVCNHMWTWTFAPFIWTLFYVSPLFFDAILSISSYGKLVWTFVYVVIQCVGAGITTLMSFSDGLEPYFLCRKMEKTRSMKEEMDGEVYISRLSRQFTVIDNMIKVLFPICTLIWRVKKLCFPPGKAINGRNESTIIIII